MTFSSCSHAYLSSVCLFCLMSFAIQAFLWINVSVVYLLLLLLLLIFLCLCCQHIVGYFLFVWSDNICLLFEFFRPFAFHVSFHIKFKSVILLFVPRFSFPSFPADCWINWILLWFHFLSPVGLLDITLFVLFY